ncbi:unnamed protein product [Sphacelaria rigidula]
MSHYTSIQTEYKNINILKKVIQNLGYAYTEDKLSKTLEIIVPSCKKLSNTLYNDYYYNYLSFSLNDKSYNMITDSQSWTQIELVTRFLKDIELNYGYSETISQALALGFSRSKILHKANNTKFIFQRCVEINV